MRRQIFAEKGAQPRGPYSHAIVADGPQVYISGQGPVDPETGEFRLGSFREQAELTFRNIGTIRGVPPVPQGALSRPHHRAGRSGACRHRGRLHRRDPTTIETPHARPTTGHAVATWGAVQKQLCILAASEKSP
jgi:hypothetical protein